MILSMDINSQYLTQWLYFIAKHTLSPVVAEAQHSLHSPV